MKLQFIVLGVTILFIGCAKPNAEEMFNKGVEAQKSAQFTEAIAYYQDLIKTYPDSSRTPEAYYAVGTIYQNQLKSYHQAIASFRQLADKYPNHATATSALFLIGFIYNNDLKNVDSARLAYDEFLRRYPDNQLVPSVQFELKYLGKDATEIFNAQSQLAQDEKKPEPKKKAKK